MSGCKRRILVAALSSAVAASALAEVRYSGPCDASAAVAISGTHFVMAEDEHNVLYIYEKGKPNPSERSQPVDLSKFLGTGKKESDLDGSAKIGNRIYWISSHGRNSEKEEKPLRYRFFATDIVSEGSPKIETVGKPYTRLLTDLVNSKQVASLGLAKAAEEAPEAQGGFNIEGLAATPEGHLLIGLRNPVPNGQAILIPLTNPAAVIDGATAEFGPAKQLDLGGGGIRSIELVGAEYYIVAGPTGDSGTFALYSLSTERNAKAKLIEDVKLGALRPEALFQWPNSKQLQLLSDDGRQPDGKKCKDIQEAARGFRSMSIDLK